MKILVFKRLGVLMAVFFFLYGSVFAQGPGMPGEPDYDPDKEVPIDGGVGLLLAAGLAYGVKKIKEMNRSNNS